MARAESHTSTGSYTPTLDDAWPHTRLVWDGSVVQWWHGTTLRHTYTFAEHVRDACTAWMHVSEEQCEPALCIALERMMYIHCPRLGDTYTLPLYFCAARLFPLQTGLLVVRHPQAHDGAAALPLAFYLRSVLDDWAAWTCVETIVHNDTRPVLQGAPQPFPAADEYVVYANTGRDATPTILVTANGRTHKVRIYHYVCASTPMSSSYPTAPSLSSRPSDIDARPRKMARRSSARYARRSSRISEMGVHRRMSDMGPGDSVRLDAMSTRSRPASASSVSSAPMATAVDLARRVTTPLYESMSGGAPTSACHPLLAHLARAYASTALYDEITVPILTTQAEAWRVHAFMWRSHLYVHIPWASQVYIRSMPSSQRAFSTSMEAQALVRVSLVTPDDAMVILDPKGAVYLVGMAPGPTTPRVCLASHGVTHLRYEHQRLYMQQGESWVSRSMDARPSCRLTSRIIEALCLALPPDQAATYLCRWFENGTYSWEGLTQLLGCADDTPMHDPHGAKILASLGLCEPTTTRLTPLPSSASHDDASLAMLFHALLCDLCVHVTSRRTEAPRLVALQGAILTRLGWTAWIEAYARTWPRHITPSASPPHGPPAPPDPYELLQQQQTSTEPVAPLHTQLTTLVDRTPLTSLERICPTWTVLWALYMTLSTATSARDVVEAMLAHHVDLAQLAHWPAGLALPLEEALRTCQQAPPRDWSSDAYRLVRRADACAAVTGTPPARVPAMVQRTLPPGLDPLSAQLFREDYRLGDVARMLSTTQVHVARLSPDDAHERGPLLAQKVSERTMAQCIGRGMFRYASHKLRMTGTWRTPRLCLRLRTFPDGAMYEDMHETHILAWPEFHNGVASALEIGATPLDSSWIFAQAGTSAVHRARHAGFLLGLGLQGHLRGLGRVHAYRYLAPRHTLTTIGLVLGLASSLLGTGDAAARQVMAVQVAAFLPPGSVPLHMAIVTQAAGLLGMGLVFCNTDHRWTAAKLATQLDARLDTTDTHETHHDVYAHCAGLGLGLVLLGRARRVGMSSAADVALVAQLCRHLTASDEAPPLVAARRAHAACLALALIFLRSQRRDVLEALAPPTPSALVYIRPDLLLVRALARALIAWDAQPDKAWLEQACPWLIDPAKMDTSQRLAFYNIRAGACLALGLQFAGTGDVRARDLLLTQCSWPPPTGTTFEARLESAAYATLMDQVHVAMACVMAGTGDVDVLRVLRTAHGTLDAPYSSQVATHMALGLLFVGGGRFSVARTDRAIAALLIACVPRFPASPDDTHACLQAARHLWVLALTPRVLAARDVTSGEACVVPVSVRTQMEASAKRMTPCLLPPDVTEAQAISRRYWPATCALPTEPTSTIYWMHVQRRTGFLSYTDDPHGHRSIFARTSQRTVPRIDQSIVHEASRLRHDVATLVRGFPTAPDAQGFVSYLCQSTTTHFGAYCTAALLDSLLRDAPMLTRFYLALWSGWADAHASDAILAIRDVQHIQQWYGSQTDHMVRGSRERLVPHDVVDSVLWAWERALPSVQADTQAYVRGERVDLTQVAWALQVLHTPKAADMAVLRTRFCETPRTLAESVLRHVLRHEWLAQQCSIAWTSV
ncbi:negative regulator of mitosis [Malassezia pachydermatis]|uniref:Negative regulator of mitosis n=1 Tax=Malassezia pachydermatis TaxID=77020 RepID=A0A0N0RSR5_9BASI|nr:negative regulator of mitosis [Malassezia pachydermatis]KOS16503.1 negative regulator of mitosis [Malassezia pachydermatis]